MIEISTLKLNDKNPRFIRDERFEKLKQSIEQFPKMMNLRPIVVDQNNVVLGGNMRLRALQALGYKSIPGEWVKKASELTEEEKRRFIVADNTGFGEWDFELLANEWDAVELGEWGLDLPDGWGPEPEAQEDDYEMPDEIETEIKEGDLIEIGSHRLLCGDSRFGESVNRLMNKKFADAVLTDPPYGQNQPGVTNDDPKIHIELLASSVSVLPIKNAAVVAFNSPRTFINWLLPCIEMGHKLERMLWLYKKAQNSYPFRGWLLTSEAIVLTSIGAANWNDVHPYKHDCYEVSEVSNELPEGVGWHGSVKPVKIVFDILNRITTEKAPKVYDPFLGSGTTMVAAQQLNRTCYGMEIDPNYCQVIIDRMHKSFPELEIKINGEVYTPKVKEPV